MNKLLNTIIILLVAIPLLAQEDTTPPILTGFSFTPDSVDVTSGPDTITFTISATDDLSGLYYCFVYFQSPSGSQWSNGGTAYFETGSLSDTTSGIIILPQYAEAGEWTISQIQIRDMIPNVSYYYQPGLEAMGFPTTFIVTSIEDVTSPTITGFSFIPDSMDVTSGPDTLTFTVSATDDLSGLYYCFVYFQSASGSQWSNGGTAYFETGSLSDTTSGIIILPQYAEAGEWTISQIQIRDMIPNISYYYASDLVALGFPTTFTVTSIEDVIAPTITGFSFIPDSMDVISGPDTLTFTVSATDNLSGLYYCFVYFQSASGSQWSNGGTAYFETGSLSDTTSGIIILPQYAEAGEWTISQVQIRDMIPNISYYYASDLVALGFPTTFTVHYGTPENLEPEILSTTDVENDQGGWVYLNWTASIYDSLGQISQYGVWELNPEDEWVSLGNVPAIQENYYLYLAHTFGDSTADGIYWSKFKVTAHTTDPEVFYTSMVDSGYSVDNLAPAVPTGLLASVTEGNTVELRWDSPVDEDFNYFKIYRSLESDFDPTGLEPFAETTDTNFVDSDVVNGETYYYVLSAVDFSGNESEYTAAVEATILSVDDLSGIPAEFGLHQNYPNPFNPVTTLCYDLPEQTYVTLLVYDLLGREVKRLVNGAMASGYHAVQWDGTNNAGESVGAGVYLYQIQAGKYTETGKMILLR